MVDDLPSGYYLDNFNFVLDFVCQNYQDILTDEELAYRNRFSDLSVDAARLYVRLTSRRGPLFRAEKLAYDEIGDIPVAIENLKTTGFLHQPEDADPFDFLSLVTKQELVVLFDDLDKRQGRDELDEIVVEKYLPVQILERLNFEVVEPLGQDHLQLFKLLFFGNLHQDFTEFVLHDLGISPFENYVMDSSGRYFDDRSLVDGVVQSYITADTCKQVLEEDDEELLAEFSVSNLIDVEVTDPGLQRRYSRLFNTTARQLERFERVEEALPLYEKSVLVPARERRSRIYHKLGDVDRAVQICREIYDDPMDEAEHEFSISFSRRLCKRYQIDCDWLEEPQKDDFSFREIAVEQDEEVNVELLACNWFLEQDIDARYVENGLLPGLFGLFFWDIIFAPVKGAFFNPFQRGPADLYTPEFRKARQDLIDDHLGLVEEKNFLTEVILQTFEEKSGFANHFVKWRWLDQTLITKSLERIPAHHLKLIFERMLRDLRNNRTGFPDLVVFPPDRDYCLSEIKGPGDRLQNNQRRWFRFFRQNEIPAEIINVIWK